MSIISDAIQAKCLAFGDRIIKLNDFLLEQAANKHQPSSFSHRTSRVPVHLQSVYIALKEARESLYWIDLLHRNEYIDDRQYESIYTDAEELVKIFVARCKKLDAELNVGK